MPRSPVSGRLPPAASVLDFSTGLRQYSLGDAANVTLDGSNRVSQWNDLSGNGAHWTQSDPNLRPNRTSANFSGKFGIVLSSATNSFMVASPTIPAGNTEHTLLIACRATSNSGVLNGLLSIGSDTGTLNTSSIAETAGNVLHTGGAGVSVPTHDPVVSLSYYVIAKRVKNGGAGGVSIDRTFINNSYKGEFQQSSAYNISPANTALLGRISTATTSGFWSVGLTAIWARALEDEELRSIFGWIRNFYSFSYASNERNIVSGRVVVSDRIAIT